MKLDFDVYDSSCSILDGDSLQNGNESGMGNLHKCLIVPMPHIRVLLPSGISADDDHVDVARDSYPADEVRYLVEHVSEYAITLSRNRVHAPCVLRMIRLRIMTFHEDGLKSGIHAVPVLIDALEIPALDCDGRAPDAVCDGCEVIYAEINHHCFSWPAWIASDGS